MTLTADHLKTAPNIRDKEITIVTIAITDSNGKVLLVRRPKTEENRPLEWECPGGHRDEGETIDEAGLREAKEEIGIEVNILPGRQYFTLREGGYGVMLHGTPITRNYKLLLEEHDKAVWTSLKNLHKFQPTPPDFEKEVKALLKGRQSRRKKMSQLDRLTVPPKKKNIRTAHSHKTPQDTIEDTQAVMQSVVDPPWEAVWQLGNLERPDYANFSVRQEPTPTREVAPTGEPHELVFGILTDALKAQGFYDECTCTKHNNHEASVSAHPKTLVKVAKLCRRYGLKVRKASQTRLVVSTTPRGRTKHGPSRKAQETTLQFTPEEYDPAMVMEEALTGDEVETDPSGMVTIKTTDPQNALDTTNTLIEEGKLQLVAGRKALEQVREVELTPEQYGPLVEEGVEDEEQLIVDLTMESNKLSESEAWDQVKEGMLNAFPGYSGEDITWIKDRFRYIRQRTSSRKAKLAKQIMAG